MADDYERLADKIELSYEEAVALKEEMRKREESGVLVADLVHPARWHIVSRTDGFAAASFLNTSPLTRPEKEWCRIGLTARWTSTGSRPPEKASAALGCARGIDEDLAPLARAFPSGRCSWSANRAFRRHQPKPRGKLAPPTLQKPAQFPN
jgi:hypothetical protein